jgi:hypothetical protein
MAIARMLVRGGLLTLALISAAVTASADSRVMKNLRRPSLLGTQMQRGPNPGH